MEKMTKQEKIDIVNESLEVLYGELNQYSIDLSFPVDKVPHIADSILKLEHLLEWFDGGPTIKDFEKLKGELKK